MIGMSGFTSEPMKDELEWESLTMLTNLKSLYQSGDDHDGLNLRIPRCRMVEAYSD
jgi:hypothetical protein